ncbi:MAG TPA: dienelactone hydrolase family protein, partial [Candidatus Ozemobacteraceae bacterium]|nr:dienelactone hydrolase family protein [Candidatus Ozemobacteraceae bacterium]
MKRSVLWVLWVFTMLSLSVSAAVQEKVVEYSLDGTALEGVLVYDDAVTDKRPGILVIHDWMGVGPYVKSRCRQLAELGYVAFAADIYGKGVRPANAQEAAKQAGIYKKDRALMRARARAGLAELQKQPHVDANSVAAIGYCFGGTTVIELARSGAD